MVSSLCSTASASASALLSCRRSTFHLSGRRCLPRYPELLALPTPLSLSRRRGNFAFRLRAEEAGDANPGEGESSLAAAEEEGSRFNQLLGIKGASREKDIWKIRLQLTKPITWVPLVWGVLCGVAASGNFHWNLEDVTKTMICMVMSGPCLAGYTQTLNDWYDREIDAINEPYRPIPSGAITKTEVMNQIWLLLLGGLGLSLLLDLLAGHQSPTVLYLALLGSLISYIYSAPPLKLKQNGWIGNFAMGVSYIGLPWWAGQAVFGDLTMDTFVLTLLYSISGLGIAIINDFKSIEGDRALGLQSLPAALGVDVSKWVCVGTIDVTQITVVGYLLGAGKPCHAGALLALILPQVFFQANYLLKDPAKYDVMYQACAQPFMVLGLLVTALAVSQ